MRLQTKLLAKVAKKAWLELNLSFQLPLIAANRKLLLSLLTVVEGLVFFGGGNTVKTSIDLSEGVNPSSVILLVSLASLLWGSCVSVWAARITARLPYPPAELLSGYLNPFRFLGLHQQCSNTFVVSAPSISLNKHLVLDFHCLSFLSEILHFIIKAWW